MVTGCTGLLGTWVTEALVDAGANVIGLIRDIVPSSRLNTCGVYDRISVVRGQVEDYALLERTVNEYQIQTVFHLAALIGIPYSYLSPLAYIKTNVEGTYNILEAPGTMGWNKC